MDPITNPEEIAALFVSEGYGGNTWKSDWGEAAEYADWNPEDVAEVIAMEEGENDGANWIMVVKLKDGRFSFLSAGCDYTGWDCQAGGHSLEYGSLGELIRMGLGQEERERLSMLTTTEASLSDPCEYVRNYYGVPAKVGMRIKLGFMLDPFVTGALHPTTGTIKGADHHLIVLMDGEKKPRRFHPTWCLDYLNSDGSVAAHYGDTD